MTAREGLTELPRYSLGSRWNNADQYYEPYMERMPDGEYVSYEDHKAALTAGLAEAERKLTEAEATIAFRNEMIADTGRQLGKKIEQLAAAESRAGALEKLLVRIRNDKSWRTNDNNLWPDIVAAVSAAGGGDAR